MRPLRIVLVFVLLFSITANAFAMKATLQGKIMQVKDGDTVVVSPEEGGQFFTCRLYGIDTPEITHTRFGKVGQPYAQEATKALKGLILGQIVEVKTTGDITHDREVCLIKRKGKDINLEMVKQGYAWAYVKHLKRPYTSEYVEAENDARTKRLGLWKDNNPMPPWEFRKMQRGR